MYDKKQIESVIRVLKNNKTNYWTGNECKKFEKEFSKYHNVKYSIAVSNGSVALELAIRSLNLSKDNEVIVSPRSFIISASSVLNLGFKPIFSDVHNNGNLEINQIKKVYTKKTRAIILVHLNGLPCDLDPIVKFAKKNKIFIIADCSQAHGARYNGRHVGSFGDVSIWSFCQDKIISTGGEGGMISTNNKKIWKKCWSLKDHGKNFDKVFLKKHKIGFKWLHDELGSNYRMTEMQATLGRHQLKNLDHLVKKRKKIANLYINNLQTFIKKDLIQNPNFNCCSSNFIKNKKCKLCIHAFYRLNLYINPIKINQLDLISKLNKKKIQCGVGPCPEIYREKVFKTTKSSPKNRLKKAQLLGKISIVFSINPQRTLSSVKSDINNIKNTLKNYQ